LMSIFHLSESHKEAYLEYLRDHSHLVLEGFPTVLNILADFILDNGSLFPMKGIFTDGEPLYPFVRAKVERAFGTKVFEHYGMTEWAGLIQECEQGGYHQISDYGILEILDEKDRPVEPGTEGYLVWTGFTNPTMPFLRYRVGDKGMMKKGLSCPCGKPFPLVSPTITREGDYLLSPDGRILSPRAVNQVLKNKTAFKSCQFIQEDMETIVIRIVRGNGKARVQGLEVQRDLISMVGGSTRVHVEEADAPLQYDNGKIPLIVSKIKRKEVRWLGSEKGFDAAVG
jgi:phenylacetate-CoA ligase